MATSIHAPQSERMAASYDAMAVHAWTNGFSNTDAQLIAGSARRLLHAPTGCEEIVAKLRFEGMQDTQVAFTALLAGQVRARTLGRKIDTPVLFSLATLSEVINPEQTTLNAQRILGRPYRQGETRAYQAPPKKLSAQRLDRATSLAELYTEWSESKLIRERLQEDDYGVSGSALDLFTSYLFPTGGAYTSQDVGRMKMGAREVLRHTPGCEPDVHRLLTIEGSSDALPGIQRIVGLYREWDGGRS